MHTPGPWKLQFPFIFRDEDSGPCGAIANVRKFTEDSIQWAVKGGPAAEANIANARLIAAAPELLEACEALVDECCIFERNGDWCCPFCNNVQETDRDFEHEPDCPVVSALAAIAKAKGHADDTDR